VNPYPDFVDLVEPNEIDGSSIHGGDGMAYQRLLDAIRDLQAGQQRIEALVRGIETKVDAMEHRLLPPGCLYIPKPEITPAGQTANVCIADPFHVAETHLEGK